MPKAIQADWKLIEMLYLQGIRPSVIEERTGVKAALVSQHACRKKWNTRLQTAVQIMSKEPSLSDLVAEQSLKARQKLSKHLVSCVDRIEEPDNMTEALEQQAKLEPLLRNAEKLFQWNQSSSSQLINITSLSAEPVQEQEQGPVLPMPSDEGQS